MNPIGLQFYNNLIDDLVKEGKYVLIFSCPLDVMKSQNWKLVCLNNATCYTIKNI